MTRDLHSVAQHGKPSANGPVSLIKPAFAELNPTALCSGEREVFGKPGPEFTPNST